MIKKTELKNYNKKIEEKIKSDIIFSKIISVVLVGIFISTLAIEVADIINISQSLVSAIVKTIILVMLLYHWKYFYKNITKYFSLLYIIILIVSLNMGFSNNYFWESLIYFLTIIIPVVFSFKALYNESFLKLFLLKFSKGIGVLLFICIIITNKRFGSSGYSMAFGYSLLVFACILIEDFIKNKNYISLITFIFIVIIIILYGSRGPLIPITIYIITILFKSKKEQRKFIFISIFFLILGLIFKNEIIKILLLILNKYNINSRTIFLLLKNEGKVHLSGRDLIYKQVAREIYNNPLKIRGISSDYLLLGGGYTHNIFLELLYEMGLIIGGILSLSIILLFIRTILFKEGLILIFAICSLFPLLVSGTLWRDLNFWVWIVLSFKTLKRRKYFE